MPGNTGTPPRPAASPRHVPPPGSMSGPSDLSLGVSRRPKGPRRGDGSRGIRWACSCPPLWYPPAAGGSGADGRQDQRLHPRRGPPRLAAKARVSRGDHARCPRAPVDVARRRAWPLRFECFRHVNGAGKISSRSSQEMGSLRPFPWRRLGFTERRNVTRITRLGPGEELGLNPIRMGLEWRRRLQDRRVHIAR